MSRSINTLPQRIQEKSDRYRRTNGLYGGVWDGTKGARRNYYGAERRKEREALRKGFQPEPQRHRHREKWNCW